MDSLSSCSCITKGDCKSGKRSIMMSSLVFLFVPKCALCVNIYAVALSWIGLPFFFSTIIFWITFSVIILTSIPIVKKYYLQKNWRVIIVLIMGVILILLGRMHATMYLAIIGQAIIVGALNIEFLKKICSLKTVHFGQ